MAKYYLTPYYIVLWGSLGGKLHCNSRVLGPRLGLTFVFTIAALYATGRVVAVSLPLLDIGKPGLSTKIPFAE